MGKKEDRQLIGLRMRASEIKRRRHELDERYGRIDGICPICGKLIRKPKRGPTARFCSRSCRAAYVRRKQDKSAELALDQLNRQGGDYRKRADGKRESTLNAHKEIKNVRKASRFSCMFQLKTILSYKPELIEQATANGYIANLMRAIDQYGSQGDAERMLRHLGYTGPIPRDK